jgi:CubicO group peptidase (beta-lactamase class C family)
VLLALLLAASTALSQSSGLTASQVEEISRAAEAAVATEHLPGLSLAVLKNGEIWSAAFGSADLEQDVRATPASMFRIASITKWLTATAALRLVEQGKLDLDAPVQRYCPQFPQKREPVTARELLSHLSGIRHNHGQNGEPRNTEAQAAALELLIQRERSGQYVRHTDVFTPLNSFKEDPLLFVPGTRFQYSSLGYRVLGCVLEGAARVPYRQLMRDLVFVPAGMTAITEDDALAIVPHRVAGYSRADGTLTRAAFRDVSENLPAGGYLATAEDLVRFAAAFDAGKLVSIATRNFMSARPRLLDGEPVPDFGGPGRYYAMGIMVDPTGPHPALFHTGGQSGASALLFLFPNDGVAVALLTNIDGSAIRVPLALEIGDIAIRPRKAASP